MKNTKAILISAKARHGKDTTANILKEELIKSGKTVLICHFADYLKMLCQNVYGWTPGDKGAVGRTILQRVGSEYRANNSDCWANIVREITKSCPEEYVIIPDWRYRNEAQVFGDMNTTTVRVIRPDFDNGLTTEQNSHISETELDNFNFDKVIVNDGTIEDLENKIKQAFQSEVK